MIKIELQLECKPTKDGYGNVKILTTVTRNAKTTDDEITTANVLVDKIINVKLDGTCETKHLNMPPGIDKLDDCPDLFDGEK